MLKCKNTAIIGASGYTGAEMVRLLLNHPHVNIKKITANRYAGKQLSEIYPHFYHCDLPILQNINDVDWHDVHIAFCCLPHGMTHKIVASIPEHIKVIDLSADFRIHDINTYKKFYGEHEAPELQKEAVYGLTEIYRQQIMNARLVANPGCYPTSALIPLIPLIKKGAIERDIIIDAKSGVSGAGRSVKEASLFCELNENINAYAIGTHRHTPEILQECPDTNIIFTPHIIPTSRGILSTIYVTPAKNNTANDIKEILIAKYKDEAFAHILQNDTLPATKSVRGSNHCVMNVFKSGKKIVIVSAIDNLVKGASGQAIHNMNVMFGFDETDGLMQLPLFP